MSAPLNYFSYFSEIEEHFQRRRGTGLLVSTLDWALIETWREADIPLEAVLRGIDAAFDKRDAHPVRRKRNVNGLAWCSQAVLEQAERMAEAAVGTASGDAAAAPKKDDGFDLGRVAKYLQQCQLQIRETGIAVLEIFAERLEEIEAELTAGTKMEAIETRLAALEDRMLAVLTAISPDDELVRIREQSARELAPYRSRMKALQLQQIERQFLQKGLLENNSLPRLSLFYMPHE